VVLQTSSKFVCCLGIYRRCIGRLNLYVLLSKLLLCRSVYYMMQLSWHPSKENLLAYGTDDGRVGIYDILSSRFVQS